MSLVNTGQKIVLCLIDSIQRKMLSSVDSKNNFIILVDSMDIVAVVG